MLMLIHVDAFKMLTLLRMKYTRIIEIYIFRIIWQLLREHKINSMWFGHLKITNPSYWSLKKGSSTSLKENSI